MNEEASNKRVGGGGWVEEEGSVGSLAANMFCTVAFARPYDTTLWCSTRTPLGTPVDPLVNTMWHKSVVVA